LGVEDGLRGEEGGDAEGEAETEGEGGGASEGGEEEGGHCGGAAWVVVEERWGGVGAGAFVEAGLALEGVGVVRWCLVSVEKSVLVRKGGGEEEW